VLLQTRKWQDKDGNDRYTTEIVANEMQMLGGRSGGTADFSGNSGGGQKQQASAAAPAPTMDDLDDDIPF